jgi:hypothetical protein
LLIDDIILKHIIACSEQRRIEFKKGAISMDKLKDLGFLYARGAYTRTYSRVKCL